MYKENISVIITLVIQNNHEMNKTYRMTQNQIFNYYLSILQKAILLS